MKMTWRTFFALYWLIFNSLFLCHFFVVLFLYGSYPVYEPSKLIAGFEVILTLVVAALGIERLVNLREHSGGKVKWYKQQGQ